MVGLHPPPQGRPVAGAQPLVGRNERQLPARGQQVQPQFHEVDVEVGFAVEGGESALEKGLAVGKRLLADVGRVAHHHVEALKPGVVVQHFGKFEAPFKCLLKKHALLVLRQLPAALLQKQGALAVFHGVAVLVELFAEQVGAGVFELLQL